MSRARRCGRDPEAGPGTCWHWYDGCPATIPDCFQRHLRQWAEERDLLDPTVDPALVREEYENAITAWRALRHEQGELL
jgi:hypothetical protein